ncbi:ABC transporter permease [Beijerinckia sp. L45]|uniref:MlaE family ABC transporter permease n=1 Tax=Beijerinckia sp. L45 TaxID=1641855 RepID=UPI00131ACD8D|nr:ABC transporter permease [Beijerinckia sp. L45]
MPQPPQFSSETLGTSIRLNLAGSWTVDASAALEHSGLALVAAAKAAQAAIFDLGGIERLDTAGAWLIDRSRRDLQTQGIATQIEHLRPEFTILLNEVEKREVSVPASSHGFSIIDLLADVGHGVVQFGRDMIAGVAFFGELVSSLTNTVLHPRRFRGTALFFHVETFAFRSVPIIALINFLVGAIVAQQGIQQLKRFGAVTFAADLIGVLILRELGVLLTSIMIAGRSGSSITAEIGSMKMREEIDALQVMGLRAMDVLVVPRLLALIISLPMLTFIADISGMFGGMLTGWIYGGINPIAFASRLREAIDVDTFLVGLIKAPFMALIIGLIAAIEGLGVEGSAESLGRQVTSSVVKSIFMVIVVDGLFAMFFASIHF